MPMDTNSFDSLVRTLPTDKARLEAIAVVSKVSYHTLLKIANGQTRNPRIRTVEAISDAVRKLGVAA